MNPHDHDVPGISDPGVTDFNDPLLTMQIIDAASVAGKGELRITPRMVTWGIIAVLLGGVAVANSVVDQGAPGAYGGWKTSPGICYNPKHGVVALVGDASAQAVPTSDLANRRFLTICNSPENAGTPIVKCADGAPASVIMGIANPGDPLKVSDCITYAVASGVKCNVDIGGTVTTYECD